MYKTTVMQWQNASKKHTYFGDPPMCLKDRFYAMHFILSTIFEYHSP